MNIFMLETIVSTYVEGDMSPYPTVDIVTVLK